MEKFFSPNSVAIIGASHTQGKVGYATLENFVHNGYRGRIYPVNPDTTPILGQRVYPSVKEVPDEIDLAVIATPAPTVPAILKECVKKRIEAVVIISGGFSEIGKEGELLEEKCRKAIARTRTRVIGPNCIGVFNPYTSTDTLFLPRHRMSRPAKGGIAFISQSGAVGSTILDWLAEEGIGISKFVSYGNAMDIDITDILEYLAEDEETKSIVVYLEGIRGEGRRFLQVAKKVVMKKPIIILKAGKTERGIKAVSSHTGSLAGSANVYSGAFKQAGVIEAAGWQELFDFAKAFSQPLPEGNRVAIVTNGGGFGVLATDECVRQGLDLAEPSRKLRDGLKKEFPPHVVLSNPMDLTGDATAQRYALAIEGCLKEYDGVVAITLFQVPTIEESVVDIITNLSKKYSKPVLCCAAGSSFSARLSKKLEANGVPVYPTPEQAVKSFAVLLKYRDLLKN